MIITVKRSGWLLDSCVYRDFLTTGQVKLLRLLLPDPCHTIPRHRDNPHEIGEDFCASQPLAIPDGISSRALAEAALKIRRVDLDWTLSRTDSEIITYAVATGFGLLTSDGAMRQVAQKLDHQVKGTLDLLEEGVLAGKCSKARAIQALESAINPAHKLRLNPVRVSSLLQQWRV